MKFKIIMILMILVMVAPALAWNCVDTAGNTIPCQGEYADGYVPGISGFISGFINTVFGNWHYLVGGMALMIVIISFLGCDRSDSRVKKDTPIEELTEKAQFHKERDIAKKNFKRGRELKHGREESLDTLHKSAVKINGLIADLGNGKRQVIEFDYEEDDDDE